MDQQEINQHEINQHEINQQEINQQEINQHEMDRDTMYSIGMESKINPRKIISGAGLALFVMIVVIVFAQGIIEYLVTNYQPSISETDWYLWATTAITMVGIGFPVFYIMIKRVPDSPKGEVVKMKLSHFFVLFFISAAAMYITNIFSTMLTVFIAFIKGDDIFNLNPLVDVINNSNFYLTLLYASLIGPVVEELIFRKFLLNKLRRFGDLPAILLTGFAFGLFHLNLSQFFYATVLGIIFAYVTIRTNTLKYSILLHIMINFIGTAIAPLAVKQDIVWSMVIMLWMIIAVTVGTLFFAFNFKKIKLEKAAVPVEKKSVYFMNLGTILFTMLSIGLIIVITLS